MIDGERAKTVDAEEVAMEMLMDIPSPQGLENV